jgi:hypothetical protein
MAREATGDTSGSDDGDHRCNSGGVIPGDGSGVTEVGSNCNTAAKARWGRRKDWLPTLMTEWEEAVHAEDEEEQEACAVAGECVARLAAARVPRRRRPGHDSAVPHA